MGEVFWQRSVVANLFGIFIPAIGDVGIAELSVGGANANDSYILVSGREGRTVSGVGEASDDELQYASVSPVGIMLALVFLLSQKLGRDRSKKALGAVSGVKLPNGLDHSGKGILLKAMISDTRGARDVAERLSEIVSDNLVNGADVKINGVKYPREAVRRQALIYLLAAACDLRGGRGVPVEGDAMSVLADLLFQYPAVVDDLASLVIDCKDHRALGVLLEWEAGRNGEISANVRYWEGMARIAIASHARGSGLPSSYFSLIVKHLMQAKDGVSVHAFWRQIIQTSPPTTARLRKVMVSYLQSDGVTIEGLLRAIEILRDIAEISPCGDPVAKEIVASPLNIIIYGLASYVKLIGRDGRLDINILENVLTGFFSMDFGDMSDPMLRCAAVIMRAIGNTPPTAPADGKPVAALAGLAAFLLDGERDRHRTDERAPQEARLVEGLMGALGLAAIDGNGSPPRTGATLANALSRSLVSFSSGQAVFTGQGGLRNDGTGAITLDIPVLQRYQRSLESLGRLVELRRSVEARVRP